MQKYANDYVENCDACQKLTQTTHLHVEPLHSETIHWPFILWGIEIVEKLPIESSEKQYIMVLTDYFTSVTTRFKNKHFSLVLSLR